MYKCQICKEISNPTETQFKLITKTRKLEKGWEILEEKEVCYKCWKKEGNET